MAEHAHDPADYGPAHEVDVPGEASANRSFHPAPRTLRGRDRYDPLGLAAYLRRQEEEFVGGPTMGDALAALDQYRQVHEPSSAAIAQAHREDREDRAERDAWLEHYL